MGTELGPREIEIVPDRAEEPAEIWARPSKSLGTACEPSPAPDEVAPSGMVDVEAELQRAGQAARRHLDLAARRRERHPPVQVASPEWAHLPLEEARFCVIDLETTGLRPGYGDEILEIGALHLQGGEIGREFETLVNPLRPISESARAVHGIADLQVAGAPRIDVALPYLLEMASGRVLVFHNAPFDMRFIQRALCEHGRDPLDGPVLDTLLLARRLLGGSCGLGSAAARLGVESPHAHRALADARLTALLLARLLEILANAGARRLVDVPGWGAGPFRAQAARVPRADLLAERLERAIRTGEPLALAYRGVAGVGAFEVRVRPLRLVGGMQLLATELDGSAPFLLDLARIERLTPA